MIIDFHTHFPPDVLKRRGDYARRDPTFAEMYGDPKARIATAEDLLASMDELGVDVSVALDLDAVRLAADDIGDLSKSGPRSTARIQQPYRLP